MINVDGIEYRNLEEQVQFLTDQYNELDEKFALKAIVDNIASVLNNQQSQITSANQQIANVNQQVQTVDGKFANYVPIVGTQTLDAKIFKIEIALQSPEGEITRLKNINNNITLTNGNGVNLLNIDEQLQTVQAFGKTLATLEDIATGQGTKVTVGGQVQSTWNADSKADTTTVSTLSQTVSTNSQNIASNTNAIESLSDSKADKTSIPSIAGLASEAWVNQQISAEAIARQQADQTLNEELQIETNSRSSADSNLQGQIDQISDRSITNRTLIDLINNLVEKNIFTTLATIQGGETRSYYALWKWEIPTYTGSTLKIIGGVTPASEGNKTIYFRMNNATETDVFETQCIYISATGLRSSETGGGWQYAVFREKSEGTICQVSTGSVWIAIGY